MSTTEHFQHYGAMRKYHIPGSSSAFRSACGDYIFTADSNGKWQLLCKVARSSVATVLDTEVHSVRTNSSQYYHFTIEKNPITDSYNQDDDSNRNIVPSTLNIVQGLSTDYRSNWSEYEARRYALLSKLFGENAAQSGENSLQLEHE